MSRDLTKEGPFGRLTALGRIWDGDARETVLALGGTPIVVKPTDGPTTPIEEPD